MSSITCHGLIAHPTEAAVLLLPGPGGGHLPHGLAPPAAWITQVASFTATLQAQLGRPVPILRCLGPDRDPSTGRLHRCYVLDFLSAAGPLPPGACWVDGAALGQTAIPPGVRERVAAWLAAGADRSHTWPTAPWFVQGWLATATTWIRTQLARLGRRLSGPLVQLRTSARGCLLQVPVGPGPPCYFKALPPVFAHEIPLLARLDAAFPEEVPRCLASDAARGWMLLPAFTGRPLEEGGTLSSWAGALRRYAEIQQASAGLLGGPGHGGPDRTLPTLGAGLRALLADPTALLLDGPPGGPPTHAGGGPGRRAAARGRLVGRTGQGGSPGDARTRGPVGGQYCGPPRRWVSLLRLDRCRLDAPVFRGTPGTGWAT